MFARTTNSNGDDSLTWRTQGCFEERKIVAILLGSRCCGHSDHEDEEENRDLQDEESFETEKKGSETSFPRFLFNPKDERKKI